MKPAIPEAILKKHTAVFGMTGSGKTSTTKLLIEQVVDEHSRVCILDPIKSDHWGLTSNKSGTGPGLPFQILGGPRGHIPLHAGAGAAIAELVGTGKLPLSIVDMSDFGPGGLQTFFNAFAPMLMRKMRGVLYLVIEEAHEFAPKEKSGAGGENMAVYHAKKLATAGRSKGIRLVVASQRVQALHNAVIGSCETVIVHRMTAPADQEPVTKWLKGTVKDRQLREDIERSMPELADGEGWICSGSAKLLERVQFPRIHTFDNSATPEDDSHRASVVTAKVDVNHLRELIGAAVDDAVASDPAMLKKQIAELRDQLARPQKPAIDEGALQRARVEGFEDGRFSEASFWKTKTSKHMALLRHWLDQHEAGILADTGPVNTGFKPGSNTPPAPSSRGPTLGKSAAPVQRPAPSSGKNADLPKGEAAILAALIQFPAGRTRQQLTVITGYARRSLETYLPRLVKAGHIETSAGVISATESGRAALPNAEPLPTGVALQRHWLQLLPEGEAKILRVLIDAAGASVTRDALQVETRYAPRSLETYLPRLVAKSLIVSGRGEVRAVSELFA